MSNELTPEQLKELQELADGILDEAKKVKEDYKENPSDVSGSIHPTEGKVKGVGVMVGMDSKYLDETKEMDGSKYIEIKGGTKKNKNKK